jgi:two-component system NtrC family sensor kinase
LAALGRLVSGIAHELNNPLTSIMGYTQLLLGRGLADEHMAEARKIFQEAERARRIVKNLLFFAREATPERSQVDLNEVVERTLALRSYELKIENIAIETDLFPNLPCTMADPYQLQQVVLNLLVNAEQALMESRGRGTVRISTGYAGGDCLTLEVADDGPGMLGEVASRIFEPFFTTKAPGDGTGLGLSIVYGIVQQHGGEILLDSRPGAGSKFRVELPLTSPLAARPQPDSRAIKIGKWKVPPSRILVVEDEPTVGQLISDVLRQEGHHVDAVRDGQEGLARIATDTYHLVICDLRMARLDGQAFYAALVGASSKLRDRIIFITGDILAPCTLEFLQPHGLPYLAKPFLIEELKLAVNQALESHSQRDSGSPASLR